MPPPVKKEASWNDQNQPQTVEENTIVVNGEYPPPLDQIWYDSELEKHMTS